MTIQHYDLSLYHLFDNSYSGAFDHSNSVRLNQIIPGLKTFIENPFLGIGLKQFSIAPFVDSIDQKKILGVYSINDDLITNDEENLFIESFDELSKKHDLIIISDYGHGLLTPKVAQHISASDNFISLNAQINAANIGTHSIRKYKDIDCLIINANELCHEMRQRDGELEILALELKKLINSEYISVTMGKAGAFLINEKKSLLECPGFASKVVDKIGSGDALLALLSICIYSKIDENLSLLIASLAAAQSVETIGNSQYVSKVKILKDLQHLLK